MPAPSRRRAAWPSAPAQPELDRFRAQHASLARAEIADEHGRAQVLLDEAESPLGWLARRRRRNGRALIDPHQLQAGERLRADFTVAHLMPRVGMNWESLTPIGGGQGAMHPSDSMVAARQRVHLALDAAGPELAGLLVDVCCFLKRLEDVERERVWPARSAKIVLQLGLERLARHYGYAAQASGRARAPLRTWVDEGERFRAD